MPETSCSSPRSIWNQTGWPLSWTWGSSPALGRESLLNALDRHHYISSIFVRWWYQQAIANSMSRKWVWLWSPKGSGKIHSSVLLNTQLVLFSLASPYTNTNTHNLIRSSSFGKHEFFQALIMSLKYIMRLIMVKKLIRIIKKYPQRFYLHLIIIIALFITLL